MSQLTLRAQVVSVPCHVLRPADVKREWMDQTPANFAYRCLPLNMANCHGWEILSPCTVEASWNGNIGTGDITIRYLSGEATLAPSSHFGSGVLTFPTTHLFETPPGYDLYVTGPPNSPKDGIYPLTGLVETAWSQAPFTMNWRFTRVDHVVRFEEGEPFCFFFPVERRAVEETRPVLVPVDRLHVEKPAYIAWRESRAQFVSDLKVPGSEAREEGWQKHYFRGEMPDGTRAPDAAHRARLRLPEFTQLPPDEPAS